MSMFVLPLLFVARVGHDAGPEVAPVAPPPAPAQGVVEHAVVPVAAPHEETFGTAAIRRETLTADRFRLELQSRTLPDTLKELPAIHLQRTGPGQTSPFLRGFTGFRTLYVVDGFRFNHSAWRDGPNQYVSTIDRFLIDRIDVRYGSGSVRYGSDAIGGTVVMETRAAGPTIEGRDHTALLETRFASADRSALGHAEVGGIAGPGLTYTVGATTSHFGDLEGGRHVGVQEGTGYDTAAADLKLAWKIGARSELVVAHQRDRTFDAPRTHATADGISWHGTTVGSDRVREFDQLRDFTYGRLDWREPGLFERIRLGLGYHSQAEDETRVRSNGNRTESGFDVDTVATYANFELEVPWGLLHFGGDFAHDDVHSFQESYNSSGALTGIAIQGPVGDNATFDATGLFAENSIEVARDTTLTAGARAQLSRADADSVRDPATGNPIDIEEKWWSWAADLRLRRDWNADHGDWIALSRAIRVPNLSDLSRFDIALSGEIETPTPGLDPEQFTTLELGGLHRFDRLETRAAVYYTLIRDMIVRFPTGNVVSGANEIQKANVGDGSAWGLDLGATWRIDAAWSIGGDLSYVAGKVDTFVAPGVTNDEPLGKLPPLHGSSQIRWDDPESTLWVEGVVTWADRQDHLNPLDELDTQRIPPDGTPGFLVYGLRGGFSPVERLDVALALENVTNRDYRLHGSGVNEPGTNLVASLRFRF
ncbi:MAG: TonB-dependent receptor [Planctomycetes bacterium]|nr:TonB-dependent receptor [Planctomycetota bacterium]